MAAKQRSTVVGVFENHEQADRAVAELRKAGFRDDQIGVAGRHVTGATTTDATEEKGTHADTGALTGALAGAGLGALAGLGILAGVIPAIGPAIAGGTLGILLSNVAAGAGVAGLVGALVGAGVPEEEAKYYEDEFRAGRTLVTVQANGRAAEARAILQRCGAYDMENRGARAVGTARAAGTSRMAEAGQTFQVREEQVRAHTRPVEAGEVRVRKEVHTEHETVDVPVEREEVVIERHAPTGTRATSGDLRPGEELRIPVKEEQVVVDKQAVVKEEVNVGKRTVRDTERVEADVRKEEVKVEREGDVEVRGTRGKGRNC
jgi:uncharacterized protein (TIGR02271 family)